MSVCFLKVCNLISLKDKIRVEAPFEIQGFDLLFGISYSVLARLWMEL